MPKPRSVTASHIPPFIIIIGTLLCALLLLSGCTYHTWRSHAGTVTENAFVADKELPDVALKSVSINGKHRSLWIPPFAFVGWDRRYFQLSCHFEGKSVEELEQLTITELVLYRIDEVSKDTVMVYTDRSSRPFKQKNYLEAVSFATDYFFKLPKRETENLRLKLGYMLTSRNATAQTVTLHTPLVTKSGYEFTLLFASIAHKSK